MAVLKRYVRNRANPEGCMIQGYHTEEVVGSCTDYIEVQNSLVYLHPYMRAGCVGEGGWEGKQGTMKDII